MNSHPHENHTRMKKTDVYNGIEYTVRIIYAHWSTIDAWAIEFSSQVGLEGLFMQYEIKKADLTIYKMKELERDWFNMINDYTSITNESFQLDEGLKKMGFEQ